MSSPVNALRLTEFFHLTFLEILAVRIDQRGHVLKGGANLRFFYASPRFSEDMDFDAVGIEHWKLREKVDGILTSRPLALLLRTHGLTVREYTTPKQTATTQRWKISLRHEADDALIRTKVEFSHRRADVRCRVEAIPKEIVAPYGLRPFGVNHYLPGATIEQKITALAERSETQARDVFDLDLLFRRWPGAVERGQIPPGRIEAAIERALALPVESFQSLVVRFLDPDLVELYGRRDAWKEMQEHVVEGLSRLR
jgi:hypothetical protein